MMTYLQTQDAVLERFNSSLRGNAKEWIQTVYGIVWDLENWTFKSAVATVTVTAQGTSVSALPADLGVPHLLQNENGDKIGYLAPGEFEERYYTAAAGAPGHFTVYGDGPNRTLKIGPAADTTSAVWQLVYERARGFYPSTTLNGAVTLPAATVTVVAAAAFPAAGSADIGGRVVAYTSKTPTTLAGCTGGTGTIATAEPVVSLTPVAGQLYEDTDVPMLPFDTHMILVHGGQAIGQALENDATAVLNDDRVTAILDGMRRRYLDPERGADDDQYGDAYACNGW